MLITAATFAECVVRDELVVGQLHITVEDEESATLLSFILGKSVGSDRCAVGGFKIDRTAVQA